MRTDENFRKAQEKVEKMKRFYKHLSTWMFTAIFLMILFFVLRVPPFVTLIAVGGWGIAVAAEAIEVFGFPGIGKDWEKRKLREELERMEDLRDRNEDSEETLDLREDLDPQEIKETRKNWRDSDLV